MIQIISPAGCIDPKYIDGAMQVLRSWGFEVSEGKHARGQYGRFSGTTEERISDLQNAIDNPDIKIVLCSRGGYGLAQIIDKINFEKCQYTQKLFIGFSDITAIHSALAHLHIPSIHGIMAKHLTELPDNAEAKTYLRKILTEKQQPTYTIPAHPLNRIGSVQGILRGGNLSVLYGLRATPFDLPLENTILCIEDIAENPYHIDRMMQNLRLSGILERIVGLVVGQFSECTEDVSMMQTIQELIADSVKDYTYPVCFDFPIGHVNNNLPLLLNTVATLDVQAKRVILS